VFVEGGACAMAQRNNGQSEPASKFTAHRAVVTAIAWHLVFIWPKAAFLHGQTDRQAGDNRITYATSRRVKQTEAAMAYQ